MGSYQPVEGQPNDMLPEDVRSRVEFKVDPAAAVADLAKRLSEEAAAPVETPAEPLTPLEEDEVKE